jgi:hypothetical protein
MSASFEQDGMGKQTIVVCESNQVFGDIATAKGAVAAPVKKPATFGKLRMLRHIVGSRKKYDMSDFKVQRLAVSHSASGREA